MADLIFNHRRKSISHCWCGWNEPGKSHPEHVAAALSAAGFGPVGEAREVAWAKGATSAGMNLMVLQAAGINPNPYRRNQ